MELIDLIDLTEGHDFEVKKASGRDGLGQLPGSFFETYSAMANTEGGVVLLGVDESPAHHFNLVGIGDPQKVIKELWNGLNNREKASVNILSETDVRIVTVENHQLVQITIPRANRHQMPVFVGKNPFQGTYRRQGDGDYRCDDETVKRMLADQVEDARDSKLLENFDFADLNLPTLQAYRNAFKSVKPDHPWVDLDNQEFLRNIGGWTMNRETKREGLTLAGLLMFGKLRPILDTAPNYVLDYQERPPDSNRDDDRRWIDRVTTDGSWSGNLYDFYRTTIQRLTRDLKVPFKLKGLSRVDDTPIHEAIRESLINTIIHADFTGRMSLYVVKRADMFGFRNPGLMRVPIQLAIRGGNSDCRNRNLQKMFQLVGLAEQAGSGLPKVYRNWKKQHWRRPELLEQINPEQTILRLRMVSLLPEETIAELDMRFGVRFRELPETARMALANVSVEGSVTHARLREMCADHPKDLSKTLAGLVENSFLVSRGATRGTVYYFPDKVPELGAGEAGDELVEGILDLPEANLEHSKGNSEHSEPSLEHSKGSLEHLRTLAQSIRVSKKAAHASMEAMILRLCEDQALTAPQLAGLLGREVSSLKNHYLKPMVKSGALKLLFPDKPSHPHQAYQAPRT